MEELLLLSKCSPSFYEGMSYIEPIVRYHLQSDHENGKVLYHSYVGSLRNYWIKAKRILTSPTPQEIQIAISRRKSLLIDLKGPLRYGSRYYDVEVSDGYFLLSDEDYITQLKGKVDNLHRVFKKYLRQVKTGKFDKISVMKAFYYLSLIFCLDPILLMDGDDALMELSDRLLFGDLATQQPERIEPLERLYVNEIESVYPLCNDAGVFSIGGYLFAYGNGVDLFGIPSQISTFDLTTDCSTEFLVHEMSHFYEMKQIRTFYGSEYTRAQAQDLVKQEHLRILTTDTFTSTDRELILLGLWYLLHEISTLLSEEGSFADLFGSDDLSFLEVPLSTRIYEEYTTFTYHQKTLEILAEIEEVYPDVYSNFINRPPTEDVPVEESMAVLVLIYAYDYYSYYQYEEAAEEEEEAAEEEEEEI